MLEISDEIDLLDSFSCLVDNYLLLAEDELRIAKHVTEVIKAIPEPIRNQPTSPYRPTTATELFGDSSSESETEETEPNQITCTPSTALQKPELRRENPYNTYNERTVLSEDEEQMRQDLITAKARAPYLLTAIHLIGCWPKVEGRPWKELFLNQLAEERENFAMIPKTEQVYLADSGWRFIDRAYPTDAPGSAERGQRVVEEINHIFSRTGLLFKDLTKHKGWPFEYAHALASMQQDMDPLQGLQFVDSEDERSEQGQRPLKKRCLGLASGDFSLSYRPGATGGPPIMPPLVTSK